MDKATHFPRPKGRSRTDTGCATLFFVCLGLMAAIVVYSFFNGDTRRLTHGFDYNGRLCGVDADVKDKPFLYFCGTKDRTGNGNFPKKLHFWSKSCVASCPTDSQQRIPCLMRDLHNFTEFPAAVLNNISFVSTLNVEITQTVTLQRSYPTETYKEHFCVPQFSSENGLRDEVINGPLRHQSKLAVAVGSFRRAWPVVLGAAVLAVIIGLAYLHILNRFAGPLIFGSLVLGAALLAAIGLFFLFGLFMNPWEERGTYQELNPIFRTFYGHEAKAYSVLVGLILCLGGAAMGLASFHYIYRIDEAVGVIQAGCECIFSAGAGRLELITQPLFEGAILLAVVTALFWGLMLTASVGYVEPSDIFINGTPIEGPQRKFRYYSGWGTVLVFYIFGSLWLLELAHTIGRFVVSYSVCNWYFQDVEKVANQQSVGSKIKSAVSGKAKPVDGIEVRGVDNYMGARAGYVDYSQGGDKVLVVPLARRGPDGKDYLGEDVLYSKKMPLGSTMMGLTVAMYYHLGSLAMGALLLPLTRPLRAVSQLIRAWMGRPSKLGHFDEEDRSPSGLLLAGFGLLSTFIDNVVGGYSRDAYVDIVLSSTNFFEASRDAFKFVMEAGGAVALLHGSLRIYEMIAVVCITSLCGGLAFILMTEIAAFRDPQSDWYISDPWTMTVLASVLSAVLSYNCMSLFCQTADTILYVFAWGRKFHPEDHKKYVPPSLAQLVGHELHEAPSQALQPQRGQLLRFSNAGGKFAGAVMSSMKTGQGEVSPLLG